MAAAIADSPPSADRSWFIVQRWQQYEGEVRANLLRIGAIGVFYLLHLWNFAASQGRLPAWGLLQLSEPGTMDRRFHLLATLLALAWGSGAAAVHLCLRHQVFPRWISAASTLLDLVMLTSVLAIADGPRSPLVAGYFLVIVLAGLRFNLAVVRLAAAGAAIGYVGVLGVAKWPATFGRDPALDLRVSRYEELVILVALALTGVFVGQLVRRTQRLAERFTQPAGLSWKTSP
ncbi:MAG: hypothetical protein DCC67_06905 [Planctomycetota bacterium]|nr:MAG: hypothetical protein DCC67_06905 [Planctomycetota bacterium]